MLFRRSTWAAAGLLALLPIAHSFAQDGSAPSPPTPAPQAAPDAPEAVLLEYKYRPGMVEQTRASMKVDTTYTIMGGTRNILPVVSSGTATFQFASRVLGVSAKGATVRTTLTGLSAVASCRQTDIVSRLQNGKLVVACNGVRLPASDPDTQSRQKYVSRYPSVRLCANDGTSRQVSGGAARLSDSEESIGVSMDFTFPKRPLQVGERWETTETDEVYKHLRRRTSHRLREIRRTSGRRIAVIEAEQVLEPVSPGGSLAANGSGFQSGRVSSVGYFDIDRGALVRAEVSISLSQRATRENGLINKFVGGLTIPAGGSLLVDRQAEGVVQDTTPQAALPASSTKR